MGRQSGESEFLMVIQNQGIQKKWALLALVV
jgi:hypothetical protein